MAENHNKTQKFKSLKKLNMAQNIWIFQNLHDRYRWVLSNILKSDWLIDSTSLDFRQSPRWGNRRQLHLDLWSKIHRLKINNYFSIKFFGAKNLLKMLKFWNGFDNPRDDRSTLDLNYFVSNYVKFSFESKMPIFNCILEKANIYELLMKWKF